MNTNLHCTARISPYMWERDRNPRRIGVLHTSQRANAPEHFFPSPTCDVVKLSLSVCAGLGIRYARRQLLEDLQPVRFDGLRFLGPPLVFFLRQ